MQKLEKMAERLYDSLHSKDGVIIETAIDQEELRQILEQYTTNKPRHGLSDMHDRHMTMDHSSSKSSLWPLVSHINVNFDNCLTKMGIRLADLPGVTDANYLRKRSASDFLDTCSHYMIVGKIDRITTDTNIRTYLLQASENRPNNVVLIATSSDDLKETDDFDCPFSLELQYEYDELYKSIQSIMKNLDSGPKRHRQAARRMANPEEQHARFLLDKYQKRCKEIKIIARNAVVRAQGQKHYKRMSSSASPLKVFCTSSNQHNEYLFDVDPLDLPEMSIACTEIPALRTYLRTLPARYMYKYLKYLCEQKVPSVLNNIEMICALDGAERRKAWLAHVDSVQKDLICQIKATTRSKLVKAREDAIQDMASNEPTWCDKADKTCVRTFFDNKLIPAGTFNVFMKKRGNHHTRKGYLSMNSNVLGPVVNSIKSAMDKQLGEAYDWSVKAAQAVTDQFEALEKRFKDDPAGKAASLRQFYEEGERASSELQQQIKSISSWLQQDLKKQYRKLTFVSDINYFVSALAEVYEECATFTKTGAYQKRKKRFHHALCNEDDNIFKAAISKFEAETKSIMVSAVDKIDRTVNEAFGKTRALIEHISHTILDNSEEGKELYRHLSTLAEPARQQLEEVVRPLLKECADIESGATSSRAEVKGEVKQETQETDSTTDSQWWEMHQH